MNGALSPRRLTCHSECLSDLEPGTGLESPITTLQELRSQWPN
ncbi:hypothetical protein Poly41_68220 [Novipirellula artificiosorum]|uniref:Uncharacterized protein n=1 Tax=Novipirellula artificiosorum TaxID=2528016 RepID=A0A5C6CZH3_9BACT|nr:hypothetical protein Poly41_68220 [Novipirellula artificiosorum]